MASSASAKKKSADRTSKLSDVFTSDGYFAVFGACDHAADAFGKLSPLFGEDLNVDIWVQELIAQKGAHKAEALLEFWDTLEKTKQRMKKDDCLRYIQIFLLLENVFRNAVIRPHIPANRIINKCSGRYCCFVRDSDKSLFEKLNFHERSVDLLVYENTDISQTIIYAITCNIFWHVLKMQLYQFPQ